jgi:hypothetical protein
MQLVSLQKDDMLPTFSKTHTVIIFFLTHSRSIFVSDMKQKIVKTVYEENIYLYKSRLSTLAIKSLSV